MKQSLPAEIIAAEPNQGAAIVHIDCPFCGKVHAHGIPTRDLYRRGEYGGRIAHCATPAGGASRGHYILTDPLGLVPSALNLEDGDA